jgi:hypothetical protein
MVKAYRSAKTGRYVTSKYAKKHPATTVCEKWKPRQPTTHNEHPQMFAAAFLDEMRKDAQLLDVLSPIQLAIQTLAKKLDDTAMQVGAEAYAAARTVYTVTKTPFAKAAMRTASDDLAKRYGRKKKAEPAAPADPIPSMAAPS